MYRVICGMERASSNKDTIRGLESGLGSLLGLGLLLRLLSLGDGNGLALVLGAGLDGSLGLGLEEGDGVGEGLGWALLSLGVEGLHAGNVSLNSGLTTITHILTLIPSTP